MNKVVAFLTEYGVVDRIIRHLELTFVAEKPPPASSPGLPDLESLTLGSGRATLISRWGWEISSLRLALSCRAQKEIPINWIPSPL